MSYKLEQLTCEDREKLVQHIKKDTQNLKNEYRTKMQIYKESLIGDKKIYDALFANYRQEYENYHFNDIQAITDEENRRMHKADSNIFSILVMAFIVILVLIVTGSGCWLLGKINSSLQSMSLANNVISAVEIAFLFAYTAFFCWITFNPFINKIYRWKDNSDAWKEFHRKRDEYAEFHAEEKLIEYKRNKANGNEWWNRQ